MFRFTIRELVLVTVIVALGVGWWIDHRQQAYNAETLRRLLGRSLQQPWRIEPATP